MNLKGEYAICVRGTKDVETMILVREGCLGEKLAVVKVVYRDIMTTEHSWWMIEEGWRRVLEGSKREIIPPQVPGERAGRWRR